MSPDGVKSTMKFTRYRFPSLHTACHYSHFIRGVTTAPADPAMQGGPERIGGPKGPKGKRKEKEKRKKEKKKEKKREKKETDGPEQLLIA